MILESRHIEHTNLKPTATEEDIKTLCEEAIGYGFKGVCVHPNSLPCVRDSLSTDFKIITVVGFPLGANLNRTKVFETQEALYCGADEIDVVWDIGAFKSKAYLRVVKQLTEINVAVKAYGGVLKVIVETCYLNDEELEIAYQIVHDSGADFIKTSTGFGPDGASLKAVEIWNQKRNRDGDDLEIKAAGGIRDAATALRFLMAGADVIGTSHGLKIMEGKYAS